MKDFIIYKLQAMGRTEIAACEKPDYDRRVAQCSEIGFGIAKIKEVKASTLEEALKQ